MSVFDNVLHAPGPLAATTHRFSMSLEGGPNAGVQWASGGTGVATATIYLSTQRQTATTMLDSQGATETDPALNRYWFPTAYQFVDGADQVSLPDGVKTSGYLPLQHVAGAALLIEFVVGVEIPDFRLACFTGGQP